MLVLTIMHGILGVFVAFFVEFPKLEVWPWLITSAIFHVIYQGCLALAYNSGDLSRVYPIARGTAPILVLLVFYFIIENISLHFLFFDIIMSIFLILSFHPVIFVFSLFILVVFIFLLFSTISKYIRIRGLINLSTIFLICFVI